jgi:hypothetical protein
MTRPLHLHVYGGNTTSHWSPVTVIHPASQTGKSVIVAMDSLTTSEFSWVTCHHTYSHSRAALHPLDIDT